MRNLLILVFILLLIPMACKENSTEPEAKGPYGLAGTWNAEIVDYQDIANVATKVDVITLGWTIQLVITEDSRYTYKQTIPGQAQTVDTGKLTFTDSHVTVTSDDTSDAPETFTWSRPDDDVMQLNSSGQYDFDGDGTPEQASIAMFLRRQ